MNGVNNRIQFQLMTPPAEAATSTTAEDVMARGKKNRPRLYWKSLEFIGPSLYKLELWKAPVCLFMQELTIRRVLDTLHPFSLPCDDTAVEKHELVIFLQSGFYKCVFVIRQDGSYLNSLTLTRLWRWWWVVLWWGLIWEVQMWLSSIRITRDDLEKVQILSFGSTAAAAAYIQLPKFTCCSFSNGHWIHCVHKLSIELMNQ